MVESDNEFDKNRRDKFRRERNDYDNRRPSGGNMSWGRGSGNRGAWQANQRGYFNDAQKRQSGFGRDYGGSSPPLKRQRRSDSEGHDDSVPKKDSPPTVQPYVKTFKQFMMDLDDDIDHAEASQKYQEYKLEFKKEQLVNYFEVHKEEEWFQLKYHPDLCADNTKTILNGFSERLSAFENIFMMVNDPEISVDLQKEKKIVQLMDAAVIFMEGGNQFDLKSLEASENDSEIHDKPNSPAKSASPKTSSKKVDGLSPKYKKKTNEESGEESNSSSSSSSESESDDEPMEKKGENDEEISKSPEKKDKEDGEIEMESRSPRALHKTSSIFLKDIPAIITRNELEAVLKEYSGYLRVSLCEPTPERSFKRRVWVTFKRDVNIKEICWNLNNVRVHDFELETMVNKDLFRRIRPVSSITLCRQVIRNDIRLASQLIQKFDFERHLYRETPVEKPPAPEPESDSKSTVPAPEENAQKPVEIPADLLKPGNSKNPILKDITDYLIEEVSAEEDELLGLTKGESDNPEIAIERDENLLKVLDCLILYLRIVHSVDFYNGTEYVNENEMPNRCGIMHARSPLANSVVRQNDVTQWIKTFESNVSPMLELDVALNDSEIKQLGMREEETEIEKFVQANCKELSTDKWLCPLSGKKFKGPDFVRKHIFNKHVEKIENVKKEVVFFNNYLRDKRRPALPEPPKRTDNRGSNYTPHDRNDNREYHSNRNYGGNQKRSYDGYGGSSYQRGGGGYRGGNRRYGVDNRRLRDYKDLDAPEDDFM